MAQLNIAITVPDEKAVEILSVVTDALGWNADLGVTRQEHLRRYVRDSLIKALYVNHKKKLAADSSGEIAREEAENISFL